MLTCLKGGQLFDPAQVLNGTVQDLFIRDGVIISEPDPGETITRDYDVSGKVVMAGLTSVGFFTSHLLPPHKQPTVPQWYLATLAMLPVVRV